ncbi:MAG: hypothetical protein FGF48_00485 [Candidatus Brockarchaeota archaeon]|nr:hypothetical protein [Candidatus Brockarchaeota archaeon]
MLKGLSQKGSRGEDGVSRGNYVRLLQNVRRKTAQALAKAGQYALASPHTIKLFIENMEDNGQTGFSKSILTAI